MARIKYSFGIDEISGSIGNTTFAKWKGLPYARSKANTVDNPQTLAQSTQRAALSELSKLWNKELTPEERVNWETFAEKFGSAYDELTKSLGGQGIIPPGGQVMSGYNAFVRANLLRESVGYSVQNNVLRVAPMGIDPPTPPLNVTAIYDPETNCLLLSYDKPQEPGPTREYEDDCADTVYEEPLIRVWTQPVGNYAKINQINQIASPLDENEECICYITEYDLEKPLHPGAIDVQLDCISPYGLRSAPSNQVRVVIPQCCEPPAVAAVAPAYEADKFCVDVLLTEVDGPCRADFVELSIKDTEGECFRFNIDREEFETVDDHYHICVPWPEAPDGDYYLRLRSGTMCAKYSPWTDPDLVNIAPA